MSSKKYHLKWIGGRIMVNQDCLDVLAVKRLKELSKKCGGRDVIPFVEFHASFSPAMSVSQVEAWAVLKSMEDNGLVEIDPFDGIRLMD
jgi:hypothetical protein